MGIEERLTAVQDSTTEILGFLCWYSCAEVHITRQDLKTALANAGLAEGYLPAEINDRDAFRRATAVRFDALQPQGPLSDGTFLNVLVRPVKTSGDEIARNIVREIRDEHNRKLSHESVAQITLRENGTVRVERFRSPLDMSEEAIIGAILGGYDLNRSHYPGDAIRSLVRRIIDDCQPVAVRPTGGVYFVRAEHEKTTAAMKVFLNEQIWKFSNSERTRFYRVPVVDSAEQRNTIQESLEDQVRRESQSFIEEIATVLQGNQTVTSLVFRRFLDRARQAKDLVVSYEQLLEREIVTTKTFLDLMERQAMTLAERVQEETARTTNVQ